MNVEQILLAIGNAEDNDIPVEGLAAAKANWTAFYPELERLIDKFIAVDTSLTDEEQTILFFGTFLLAELKYSPALEKCLQLFARSDSLLTPIETVFGDALTELTPTLFYNVVDGNSQALCNYIVDGHQAMYGKASAIEAVFAQYEAGIIDEFVLSSHVTRWLASFLAASSTTNSFLLSALADYCIDYQLDNFKSQFIALCDKNIFDEERFQAVQVKGWDNTGSRKLIESGMIQTQFSVVNTFTAWADSHNEDQESDSAIDSSSNEDFDGFDKVDSFESLMAENGLLANILYDEKTILENSVPVSTITAGRNDPCPCGSGKKYKKCCLR
ncbi:DUF1186 domain-containing protein [Colwellia sp. E2M01]|uniref:DUF1186 domain-containing protein n=1 Tax=Colwellia sp. E2M01 TaxID=2841561 RepID=UPI001C08E2D0|nr:DUF1186 domain-containing protein [Colwellia sp. E2M01]MBU2870605.1 DUF1186 domain-containing protein [Colwellia sp. E2M01]